MGATGMAMTMEDAQVQRKTRINGQRTRRRLLASAVSLWSQRGLLGVTVSAVAEHAGTTRRTVYHHFPTQEMLLEETERFVVTELAALAGGDTSYLSQPYGLVAGLAADNPDLIRSVLLGMLREDPRENAMFKNGVRYWSEVAAGGGLRDGIPPEHAAAVTLAMWLAATLVVSTGATEKERRAAARSFAASFEALLTHGILTSPPQGNS
ncbi:TetR family transcriptional regulator [Sphingobium wenxiniae]|nr:TetR family transcriptional regulator [Sphingobium wenxiniae]